MTSGDEFDDDFTPRPTDFAPGLSREEADRKMLENELARTRLAHANLRATHEEVMQENRKLRTTLRRLVGRIASLEQRLVEREGKPPK